MIVGVAGIGLIGGSFARDYKQAGHTVYVYDRTERVSQYAILAGVADGTLDEETIPQCDLLLIALFPNDTIEYLKKYASIFNKDGVVMDCGGTKLEITKVGFALAEEYGFTYIGGHPMAGTQYSGFKNSFSGMFEGQPMVIVPPVFDDIYILQRMKDLLAPCRFGHITVATAEEHDRMIAFTSQMAHVVSCCYIKSPTAQNHIGLSAGSYKDMTRVARLNPVMWTQLFLDNSDNLVAELDDFIHSVTDIRNAINDGDADRLCALLQEGRDLKEKVDGSHD